MTLTITSDRGNVADVSFDLGELSQATGPAFVSAVLAVIEELKVRDGKADTDEDRSELKNPHLIQWMEGFGK
jgi:hypothetical protein